MAETITIERLAAGGDGVGRLGDGLTVFVPRTAPGDRVVVEVTDRRSRHAFGRPLELREPGPRRVEPRCAHFAADGCGGCQWQHLAIEAQRLAKARIVGDALRRIGKLEVEDPPVAAAALEYGYRGTVTLAVRGPRGRRTAGLHRVDGEGIFQLDRCEIAREPLNALWKAIRGSVDALPEDGDVRVALRVSSGGELHVVVRGGRRAWGGAGVVAGAAAGDGLAATVWWEPEGGAVRRMAGPAADPAAVAFEQVNAEVAASLRADVVGALERGGRLLDLYAGSGEAGLALAERGADVVTVEVDGRATAWTAGEAARRGLRVRSLSARVEDVLAMLLPADAVLVNPPRTGLERRAAEALRATPPARLAYVSCDPATLARDLARLGADQARIAALKAYDMFPQTCHVETLAVVERWGPPGGTPRRAASRDTGAETSR